MWTSLLTAVKAALGPRALALLLLALLPASQGTHAATQVPGGAAPLDPELRCLALNIYFEARGEPEAGRLAVGHVVLNRMEDPRFPDTICAVVKQGGEDRLHRCQFSWWCDGQSDTPRDAAAWAQSRQAAQKVYWALDPDPTGGALWYHAHYVAPDWRHRFVRSAVIGQHIFYQRATQVAARN